MHTSDLLIVRLVDLSGHRLELADVYIDLTFFLHGVPRYGFRFGPTDATGVLRVTYADAEHARQGDLILQPWDYKTKLDECDPTITISMPGPRLLASAYETAKIYFEGCPPREVEGWLSSNNGRVVAEPLTVALSGPVTDVLVPCATRDRWRFWSRLGVRFRR